MQKNLFAGKIALLRQNVRQNQTFGLGTQFSTQKLKIELQKKFYILKSLDFRWESNGHSFTRGLYGERGRKSPKTILLSLETQVS